MVTLSAAAGLADDGEAEDAQPSISTPVASMPVASMPVAPVAAEPAPARATGDIILLSIPDAGGLRLTVSSDNKLHTFIAGHDLPATPPIPQAGFTADPSGYVNGGSATLQGEHILKNLFGTGLDVKIAAGTKFTGSLTGLKLEKVGSGGGVSLLLPLKDDMGKKTEIDIAPLTINRDGGLQITGDVIRTVKANLPGGFSLSTQYLKVEYKHTPGAGDDEAAITLGDSTHGGVDIQAPIPGVLTQNPKPLTLHVDSATVNTDGQVSFTGAKLSQSAFAVPPAQTGTQIASLRPVVKTKGGAAMLHRRATFPLEIPLMKPFDFIIRIEKFDDVTVSMANNVPTELTINCKIKLPASFTTTPGGAERVTAEGVTLDVGRNGFIATISNVPKAYFKGFGVQIKNAVLDLSEAKNGVPSDKQSAGPAGGVAWEGVYLTQATLVLPDSLKVENDSTSANPPDLTLSNAWIDNNGFTGQVTLTGGKFSVEDFAVALKKFDVAVQRSSIKSCDISGTIAVAALGGNPIDVEAAVADSGLASLHITTGKIVLDDFGAEMTLQNGTLQRVADKTDPNKLVTVLALTGDWKFTDKAPTAVQGMAVQVKDLQVDSTGKFTLDSVWIKLPEDTSLDFDVVSLQAEKIGFGGIGTTPWVGFTGSVEISGDLPVQAGADFDGLYIYKGGHIHVGRIGVDCDVKGVLHISGFIEQSEGAMTRSVKKDGTTNLNKTGDGFLDASEQVDPNLLKIGGPNGTPLSILTGRVALELPILGGGGAGGALEFMIARNCWFVMGSFSSDTPLIPIGQSGLSIYGFGGGVGYNIKPEFPGATGIPQRNYQVIPDVDAIAGTPTQSGGLPLLLVASVRLGSTVAPPPIWGDITFVADMRALTFTLQGDCYVGETLTPDVPAVSDQKSRVLSASISYDVRNSTFLINGSARFDLPKKEMKNNVNNSLVHLQAPFRFKIGKYDQTADNGFDQDANHRVFYAALGGPVDLGQESTNQVTGVKAHRDVVINNPVTVHIRGLDPFTGAVAVDMNRGQFRAALKAHQTFSVDSNGVQSVDIKIATLKYQYKVSGELDALGWVELDFPGSDKAMNMDDLSASGEFYLYASLDGTLSNLEVDTFFHNFQLDNLGVHAVLEADVAGSLTPHTFNIHGQVYADLDFHLKNPIKDVDVSLPYSKDVDWTSSL